MSDTAPTTPVLEARGLTKTFGQVQALRGVDFAVYPGEVVGLVGDNGAGKSTLTKMFAGTLQPDAGEILCNGQPAPIGSPTAARRLGVEIVYQDLALAPDLDPASNFFLGRELRSSGMLGRLGFLDKKSMRARSAQAFAALGVRLASERVGVGNLSGGQRQGIAVCRAATWANKVLFMDEPTAALGVMQTRGVLDLVRRVRDSGVSVVYISHNLPEVFEVCNRVEVLRLGKRAATFNASEVTMEKVVGAMTGATEEHGTTQGQEAGQ